MDRQNSSLSRLALGKFSTFALALGSLLGISYFVTQPTVQAETSPENSNLARKQKLEPLANYAVVELYTSEGCHSCPPAEKLLNTLGTQEKVSGAQVVPLAFHVDYWDRLGWKDELASAANTQRQRAYAVSFGNRSVYTPQMVVNGSREFVGSNSSKAKAAIGEAGLRTSEANTDASPLPKIEITRGESGGIELISAAGTGEPTFDEALAKQTLTAYITESGFKNSIKRGENRGKVLEHEFVVRATEPLTLDQTISLKSAMSQIDEPARGHLTIVLQRQKTGRFPVPLLGEIMAVWRTPLKAQPPS